MRSDLTTKLFEFLQEELEIPVDTLETVLGECDRLPNLLPIALWQSGVVTLEQLDKTFAWMELVY